MNGFYLAKKNLKYSGYLDLVFILSWSLLFFLISLHNFCVEAQGSFTSYHEFFKTIIKKTTYFNVTVWHFVLTIFIISLISFLGKVILGSMAFFSFLKSRSLLLISASVIVLFIPLLGGIVAINTSNATTSSLPLKYVSSFSMLRSRFRRIISFWMSSNADNK